MKNLSHFIQLFLLLVMALSTSAQTAKSKNINGQLLDPETNCVLRYYYFPNLEAYFDTQKSTYYYTEHGQWKTAVEIPGGYRGYSLYNKISVVINDFDDDDPTQMLNRHKKKYPYITKENVKRMTASLN